MIAVVRPPHYFPLQPKIVINEYTDTYLRDRAQGRTDEYGDQCRILLTIPENMRQSAWAAAFAAIHPSTSEWEIFEDEGEFIATLRWVIAFYTQETTK